VKALVQQVHRSAAFYPTAVFWVVASVVAYIVATRWAGLLFGFAVLSVAAILAVLVSTWREVLNLRRTITTQSDLIDGQRAETLEALDEMRELLIANGIPPPEPSAKEREARQDEAEGKP
jgi:hypothetical protein